METRTRPKGERRDTKEVERGASCASPETVQKAVQLALSLVSRTHTTTSVSSTDESIHPLTDGRASRPRRRGWHGTPRGDRPAVRARAAAASPSG